MKLSRLAVALGLSLTTSASAGGLLLPGAGAKSTSRAGASTVAADDGEAISLNPAGIAKSKGTTITLGFAAINYSMSFHRNGNYDTNDMEAEAYEGSRYPIVENNSKPSVGIGSYLPVPAFGIVSDLGGAVPKLHVGFGLYTTNAYPNRDMNSVNGKPYFVPQDNGGFDFPNFGEPPPPTRYDIIAQEALIVMPAIVAAYEVLPNLDVGARFQAGFAQLKSTVAVWGGLANYPEVIRKDGIFTLDAKDSFIYGWGLGANYRATPNIEIGAHYNAQVDITGRGDAVSANGPGVDLSGQPVAILPVDDDAALCARGGTPLVQKGCVELALPMSATIGARYKFLDAQGKERGDLELDAEADLVGLGEPQLGSSPTRESGERLMADDVSRLELDDRLVGDTYRARRVQHLLDGLASSPHLAGKSVRMEAPVQGWPVGVGTVSHFGHDPGGHRPKLFPDRLGGVYAGVEYRSPLCRIEVVAVDEQQLENAERRGRTVQDLVGVPCHQRLDEVVGSRPGRLGRADRPSAQLFDPVHRSVGETE